jgi:hypothetical protein
MLSSNASFAPSDYVGSNNGVLNYDNGSSGALTHTLLSVLNPGSTVSGITFSYVSYGYISDVTSVFTGPNGTSVAETAEYFAFGLQTPFASRPTTGTATYSGIAVGRFETATDTLSLRGTASLNVDFGAQSLTTSLALKGDSLLLGAAVRDFGVFAGSASIVSGFLGTAGSLGAPHLAFGRGNLTNAANPLLTGSFAGSFFGPAANEFGYQFNLSEANAAGSIVAVGGGVAIGTKN